MAPSATSAPTVTSPAGEADTAPASSAAPRRPESTGAVSHRTAPIAAAPTRATRSSAQPWRAVRLVALVLALAGMIAGMRAEPPVVVAAIAAPASVLAVASPVPAPAVPDTLVAMDAIAWPEGTERLRFENVEGIILLDATLRGGERDTTGPLVLDTGAGYLALDHELAVILGVAERTTTEAAVALAVRPLARLELGGRQMDQISPVLTVDGEIVRNVTDRPVLGLIGHSLIANSAVVIDYRAGELALVPVPPAATPIRTTADTAAVDPDEGDLASNAYSAPRAIASVTALGAALSARAVPVPFTLEGDGKIVVRARVSNPRPPRMSAPLTVILDTGATKTVLFGPSLDARARRHHAWPTLRGLSAPTLFGDAPASLARVPRIELEAVEGVVVRDALDVAVLTTELQELLVRVTRGPVDGLIGYSFLRRYRVAIDYPNRIVWLDPQHEGWDDRPWEFSNVGIQIERREGEVRVVAVAAGSPAARAGVRVGDVVASVEGRSANDADLVDLSRLLEGPPGTRVDLVLRREGHERGYRLERRQLL